MSTSEGPSLGVRVSLPPGTLALAAQRKRELARRSQQQDQEQVPTTDQLPQDVFDDEEDQQQQGENEGRPRPIGIDLDREIVPFQMGDGNGSGDDSTLGAGSNSEPDLHDEEDASAPSDDGDDDDDDDDDDAISQSPPTSLPLLSIDIVELTGCTPSNAEEKNMLVDQVRAILVGESNEDGSAEEEAKKLDEEGEGQSEEAAQEQEQEPPWVQFNDRSIELFNMGAASHDDTTHQLAEDDLHHCQLEYPEFLPVHGNEEGGDNSATVVMPTSRIWKILTSSHRIAPVDRIMAHLSETSRDLVWRYRMNSELRHLARTEQTERDRRHRTAALEEWTAGGRRKLELERLYQVRETFEYRLNAARKSLGGVVGRREDRVRSELGRRREAGISGGGVDGLDWAEGAATFVFGDEEQDRQNLREVTPTSDLAPMTAPYQDDGCGGAESDSPYGSSSEESGYELEDEDSLADGESDDEDGHAGVEESNKPNAKASSEKLSQSRSEARAERRRTRAAKSSKRMRKKLALQEEAAKRRSMTEAAKAEERDVRRMCTLPEEELAKAVVDQLEERMAKIDALLEKIQDEEWAEEEGDGDMTAAIHQQDGLQIDVLYDDLDEERHHRPLLDQILAMILGAARPPEGRTKEEHFEFIRDEHQSIVSDWWKYFGRLPPSLAENEEAAVRFTPKEDTPPAESEETLLVAGALTALRFDDDGGAASSFPVTNSKKISSAESPTKQTPAAMRSMLGIADNDGDDWDDVDVDGWGAFDFADESVTATGASGRDKQTRPNNKEPKKVGLRPGGRML